MMRLKNKPGCNCCGSPCCRFPPEGAGGNPIKRIINPWYSAGGYSVKSDAANPSWNSFVEISPLGYVTYDPHGSQNYQMGVHWVLAITGSASTLLVIGQSDGSGYRGLFLSYEHQKVWLGMSPRGFGNSYYMLSKAYDVTLTPGEPILFEDVYVASEPGNGGLGVRTIKIDGFEILDQIWYQWPFSNPPFFGLYLWNLADHKTYSRTECELFTPTGPVRAITDLANADFKVKDNMNPGFPGNTVAGGGSVEVELVRICDPGNRQHLISGEPDPNGCDLPNQKITPLPRTLQTATLAISGSNHIDHTTSGLHPQASNLIASYYRLNAGSAWTVDDAFNCGGQTWSFEVGDVTVYPFEFVGSGYEIAFGLTVWDSDFANNFRYLLWVHLVQDNHGNIPFPLTFTEANCDQIYQRQKRLAGVHEVVCQTGTQSTCGKPLKAGLNLYETIFGSDWEITVDAPAG